MLANVAQKSDATNRPTVPDPLASQSSTEVLQSGLCVKKRFRRWSENRPFCHRHRARILRQENPFFSSGKFQSFGVFSIFSTRLKIVCKRGMSTSAKGSSTRLSEIYRRRFSKTSTISAPSDDQQSGSFGSRLYFVSSRETRHGRGYC